MCVCSCRLVVEAASWLLGFVGDVVLHRGEEDEGGEVSVQAAVGPPGVSVNMLTEHAVVVRSKILAATSSSSLSSSRLLVVNRLHHRLRDVKHISQGASSIARSPAAKIHLSVVSGMVLRSILNWSSIERQLLNCCRCVAHREKCVFMRSKVPGIRVLMNVDGRRSLG